MNEDRQLELLHEALRWAMLAHGAAARELETTVCVSASDDAWRRFEAAEQTMEELLEQIARRRVAVERAESRRRSC